MKCWRSDCYSTYHAKPQRSANHAWANCRAWCSKISVSLLREVPINQLKLQIGLHVWPIVWTLCMSHHFPCAWFAHDFVHYSKSSMKVGAMKGETDNPKVNSSLHIISKSVPPSHTSVVNVILQVLMLKPPCRFLFYSDHRLTAPRNQIMQQ